jgi:hypothetical protein
MNRADEISRGEIAVRNAWCVRQVRYAPQRVELDDDQLHSVRDSSSEANLRFGHNLSVHEVD